MNTNVIKQSTRMIAVMTIGAVMVLVSTIGAFAAKPSDGPTIVDTAIAVNDESGEFSTLISAVVNLGLRDVLSGNRQFTVFAPTDAAFDAAGLNADSFIGIDEATADIYRDIVLYHVTNGVRYSQSVVGEKSLRMANGDRAMVSGATIDGAGFVATDIRTSNGVIHIVDTVLLPPADM